MTFSFIVNGLFTFRAEKLTLRHAATFLATTGVTMWAVQPVAIHLLLNLTDEVLLAKLGSIAICFVLNFAAYRLVVWPMEHHHEDVVTARSKQAMSDPVRVLAIHVAPGRRLPMKAVAEVEAEAGRGLVGDRYHGSKHRQVTVQSREQLDAAAVLHGAPIPESGTRRNITLSQGEIPTTAGARLRIGDVLLEVVRIAAPCKLMDDTFGRGAQDALRRRAGTVFRVLESGTIAVGDEVVGVSPPGRASAASR